MEFCFKRDTQTHESATKRGRWLSTHWSDFPVVVLFREVPCQTKVTNLQQEALGDQNIPGSQITVNTLALTKRGQKEINLQSHN